VTLPEPPIVVDYSAQNDGWSKGHDTFIQAMNARKYPLFLYWGPFGHANNHANILKVNDLINSFDWLAVKKNEAYPVFTNASTNDVSPWPDHLDDKKAGQINAFLRWKDVRETSDRLDMTLYLTSPEDLKTTFTIPKESTVDVSVRRLQMLKIASGEKVNWSFEADKGVVEADTTGLVTITGLKVTQVPANLTLELSK